MSEEKTQRNIQITKEKLAGATYYELAKKYNLHPNRIFTIVKNTKLKFRFDDYDNPKPKTNI